MTKRKEVKVTFFAPNDKKGVPTLGTCTSVKRRGLGFHMVLVAGYPNSHTSKHGKLQEKKKDTPSKIVRESVTVYVVNTQPMRW